MNKLIVLRSFVGDAAAAIRAASIALTAAVAAAVAAASTAAAGVRPCRFALRGSSRCGPLGGCRRRRRRCRRWAKASECCLKSRNEEFRRAKVLPQSRRRRGRRRGRCRSW